MMKQRKIWVIDDDEAIRWVLERAFSNADFDVRSFSSAVDCLAELDRERPDALFTDIRMPEIFMQTSGNTKGVF